MALALYQNLTKPIYKSLEKQIESSNLISDLLPIMNSLFDLKELKIICKNKLKESNNKLKIRKVYLNSNPISNILSKDLIVNILKFNETKEYPTMFCLSKTFNKLMNKNPILFANYKILVKNDWSKEESTNLLIETCHKVKGIQLMLTTNNNSPNITFPFLKLHNLKLNDLTFFENKILVNKYKLKKLMKNCYVLSIKQLKYEMSSNIYFKNMFSLDLIDGLGFYYFNKCFNLNKLLNLKIRIQNQISVMYLIQYLNENCNNLLVLGLISFEFSNIFFYLNV